MDSILLFILYLQVSLPSMFSLREYTMPWFDKINILIRLHWTAYFEFRKL